MSEFPGWTLEDWANDFYIMVVDPPDYFIERVPDLIVLTSTEFAEFVAIHEPLRERVEQILENYDQEDRPSWRSYRNACFDRIPDDIAAAAQAFLEARRPRRSGPNRPDSGEQS